MKIKTNQLAGEALDWAVLYVNSPSVASLFKVTRKAPTPFSTNWAHGGPIIEREGIALHLWSSEEWIGDMGDWEARGPTPLIAAMRCYVSSNLGEEVDVPDELVNNTLMV